MFGSLFLYENALVANAITQEQVTETISTITNGVNNITNILNSPSNAANALITENTGTITDVSNAIISMVPPILANNYPLIIGALFAYVALHLLKAGAKMVITIALAAVVITILTNAGMMPDLNQIFSTFADFLTNARNLPVA